MVDAERRERGGAARAWYDNIMVPSRDRGLWLMLG